MSYIMACRQHCYLVPQKQLRCRISVQTYKECFCFSLGIPLSCRPLLGRTTEKPSGSHQSLLSLHLLHNQGKELFHNFANLGYHLWRALSRRFFRHSAPNPRSAPNCFSSKMLRVQNDSVASKIARDATCSRPCIRGGIPLHHRLPSFPDADTYASRGLCIPETNKTMVVIKANPPTMPASGTVVIFNSRSLDLSRMPNG